VSDTVIPYNYFVIIGIINVFTDMPQQIVARACKQGYYKGPVKDLVSLLGTL